MIIRLTISLLLAITMVGCGDEGSPLTPSPIPAPTAVPSGVALHSGESLGETGPVDLRGLDVLDFGEGVVDIGAFEESMLDLGIVDPGTAAVGTFDRSIVEPGAGARVLDTGIVDAVMPGLGMSDAVELDPAMLDESERGAYAASVKASGDIDFSSVTWSWNSGNSHLMPSDIPDGRVVADVGGGTEGQTNVWRRSNGTGLIRILSRSNLDGSTFRTAGLTKTLSHRRDVRGVGLYVAGVTAGDVKTIESASGRGGRGTPIGGTTDRPAAGCTLNMPASVSVSGSGDGNLSLHTTVACAGDHEYTLDIRKGYQDNADWFKQNDSNWSRQVRNGGTEEVWLIIDQAASSTTSRTGKAWFKNIRADGTNGPEVGSAITITQACRFAPPIDLSYSVTGPRPSGNAVFAGSTLTVTAAVPRGFSASYEWTITPTAAFSSSADVATWVVPNSTRGEHTFSVSASSSVCVGDTVTEKIVFNVVAPPVCNIEAAYRSKVDGRIHPDSTGVNKTAINFGSGGNGGYLVWRKAPSPTAQYCPEVPTLRRSQFMAANWSPVVTSSTTRIRAVSSPTNTIFPEWPKRIEFSVPTTTESTAQNATIWMDTAGTGYEWPANQRVPIRRSGVRVAPTCPPTTPAADDGKTRSYSVGDTYRMEGMTQNWTHLSNGRDGGGCSSTGFRLNSTGEQHICGYNSDASVCTGRAGFLGDANRTDPTAVKNGTSTVAEWVAVRVQAPREAGCTNPNLKVRTDGEDDWIHLHFGCTHVPAVQGWYGSDSDYSQWGLQNATLTWTAIAPPSGQTDPTTITTPAPLESTNRPGSFELSCPATTARPINGFKVTGTVTYNSTQKSDTTGVSGICAQ